MAPDVVVLPPDDASEGGAQEAASHRHLRDPRAEELEVLGRVVEALVGGHRPVGHQPRQLVPGGDRLHAAKLSIPAILQHSLKMTRLHR